MFPRRLLATELEPDDRLLILGIPEPDFLREASARLTAGMVVALAEDGPVRAARLEFRSLVNVMFVPGTPEAIPWQDRYFTKVVDVSSGAWPNPRRVAAEVSRVLLYSP